eukprot:TRINITY_DN4259_c0_g1_i7.p1 TRINITY_DN4259_c0_g1~~TRINITY_DN4259_c0_g1_i7.p1  ORF type:complete len:197 (-),score=26.66 TRINITY_DN4259_c0_g1_i7:895-1485(-)
MILVTTLCISFHNLKRTLIVAKKQISIFFTMLVATNNQEMTGMNTAVLFMGCGSNSDGQIGLGHRLDTSYPQNLDLPFPSNSVEIFSCGGSHTFFKLYDGSLYACGLNSEGQILDSEISVFEKVTPISSCNNHASVICGWASTSFITPGRHAIEALGSNQFGLLGSDIPTTRSFKLSLPGVQNISKGLRHCCAVLV